MQSFQETFEVGGSFIYGRADDINRIIQLLSLEDRTNVSSTFVSIVADRGTGRTTLLHILHNRLCSAFDKRKFICMPEKFDEERLMRVIIESLTGTPCDIVDLEDLEETVKEELMDQTLLLLLDNFENKSQKCWDLLSALLKVCKKKSAVVVTATRKSVSEVQGPMLFYYMNNLSDEWCLMIFKQCVFNGQNPDADNELADIGRCLVSKCKNVTLGIKMLSGLLRHSITEDWWRVVLDNTFWEMNKEEGGILPALRVCYEYLPPHLKQCFKYCSLFPKEYIFSKKHLVHMWLSQGFIEPGEGRDIEDIGLEYFDQLLSRSFFQPSLFPHMEEDRFVMPWLINDFAKQISKNECLQIEGSVQSAPESIRHFSLVAYEFQSVSLSHLITRVQDLHTLLVLSRFAYQHFISSCILHIVELDDIFVKFHSLVTLNLNSTNIEELPESFGSLNKLRYLILSGTNIKKIPLEISNLVHLQTLEAKDCHYLGELPRTIEVLTNLRYLDVTKEVGSVVMPHGIGNLTNLRNLAIFNVGMDPLLHCGIDELKNLVHLKGCLEISGLINVTSGIDANESHMRSKENIETLFLNWSDEKISLEGGEGTEIAEEVLEGLYPTTNLKEFIIREYPGNSFPMWVECAHFPNLVSIIFDHCYNCERLPDLGRLPSLKFLSIRKMYSVKKLNLSSSEYNLEISCRFPTLAQLTIWEMYELEEWVEIGNQFFPALQSLCINNCPLLRNVPKFPALVELSVYSHAQFLDVVDLQSLQSLRVEGLQKTKSVKLSKDLVRLKKLEISHCPELLSIEGLSLFNSLEAVIFFRCPQLDSHVILDGRLFNFEERRNTSVWLHKEKLAFSDKLDYGGSDMCTEGHDHPIALNKRKYREDLSFLSGVLADGHKKFKDLESQMSMEDHELVETTVQRLVETVQSSIAVRSAILDSSSHLMQNSESPSPVVPLRDPASGSGITQDPYTEVSKPLRVITGRYRKKDLPRWRTQLRVTDSSLPPDDGYTWRKYGQKDILGCKFPRSYFRCKYKNTQGCMAIKQIQKTDEDPYVYDVVYQGIHICRDTATAISVTPSQELIPATESPSTYFSFMSPKQDTSSPREEEALINNPLSSSASEPIAWQQKPTLSLSMSSEAISDARWEKPVAFSPVSSSFDARSETESSDSKAEDMQLALENLETIKVIGKGRSGIVQLLRHRWTGRYYALKGIEMNIQETICKQIVQELEINQASQCPQIVVCYHSFFYNGVIFLVLEYMDRGSLADIIKQVKTILEPYLAVVCKQVLKGLVYLHHERHVIHQDIKPSTLLINHKGEVKISDFGVSAVLARSMGQRDTFVRGHNYMSPERMSNSSYDYKSDIWSLGLTLLECATGRFPYIPSDESKGWISFCELLGAIDDHPPPALPPDQFSPEFCSFISACIQKDPKERMSSVQLLDHPFMKKFEDEDIDFGIVVSSLDPP